ncbi:flavoprotein-like protein [Kockiozyma suomiensis]|uniref:flavoprotein-like protein n=1 Tax=Kockiozyma suomiensis TaxID=1337062 RepID=UPI00334394F3
MVSKPLVYIVIGSTRVGRAGPAIAQWTRDIAAARSSTVDFRILDLIDFNLPLHSPHIPITGYAQGFVFVTPIYNGSYPGVLKLYLDYLKKEWARKPVGIVSYSHRGGDRAAVQLKNILRSSLQMNVIDPPVLMKLDDVFPIRYAETEGPLSDQINAIVDKICQSIEARTV